MEEQAMHFKIAKNKGGTWDVLKAHWSMVWSRHKEFPTQQEAYDYVAAYKVKIGGI